VAEFGKPENLDKIGVSIDFLDVRARNGSGREYTLSSIHQGKLFRGAMIGNSDQWGQGKIDLKNGGSQF